MVKPLWDDLNARQGAVANRPILDLFTEGRAADFSLTAQGMLFDYSKTNMDRQTRDLLLALAEQSDVTGKRDAMFAGQAINETEGRAVLHTALRNLNGSPVYVDGQDVMPGILDTLSRMETFAQGVRQGQITASDGGRFDDIVNIGIGGSDLGPAMACLALAPYHDGPRCHFVSNVDGADIRDTLAGLDPARTLVIVASKTFTTIETMTNAQTARRWLTDGIGSDAVGGHLAAVSSANEKTLDWGIEPTRVFGFEDWVGGRYSVWGPVGLSLMIAIGASGFRAFLGGAQAMDRHFCTAPLSENMPVLLALVGLWHHQVCGYATRAVLPYENRLFRLPAYFQQLEMESNGKGVAMDGHPLTQDSVPVIWGEPGTNGQHAFYQMIHQGTQVVPCEFMVARRGHEPDLTYHHRLLVANCLAQSEALMRGRSESEALALMQNKGLQGEEALRQARHRVFAGNRPSTTLIYDLLTPETLGKIIALYEHRVFVEGAILGLNSFDQWGVELGKELAVTLEPIVAGQAPATAKDPSTRMLVDFIRQGAPDPDMPATPERKLP